MFVFRPSKRGQLAALKIDEGTRREYQLYDKSYFEKIVFLCFKNIYRYFWATASGKT
jgi:hypothetical protein